jgi:hypothetical protein
MPMLPRRSRRPAPPPDVVAVGRPRLDGSGWPEEVPTGRGDGFQVRTLHEMAQRSAYEPEAHIVGGMLLEAALPALDTDVPPADAPYLEQVYRTAARMGAGLAMVGRGLPDPGGAAVDRRLAAALWQARRALPAMPAERTAVAAWFLLAGFHLARGGPERAEAELAALLADLRRA